MVWIPVAMRAYAPSIVSWWLSVAGGLRLEQLRSDHQAQQLVAVVQWGVIAMLVLTSACIVATSVALWRSRCDGIRPANPPAVGLSGRA